MATIFNKLSWRQGWWLQTLKDVNERNEALKQSKLIENTDPVNNQYEKENSNENTTQQMDVQENLSQLLELTNSSTHSQAQKSTATVNSESN